MNSIERMDEFFTARIDFYDAHMLTNIEGINEAYARVAALLPENASSLLDLGCGTGLELTAIFDRFYGVQVTGIDITRAMLDRLIRKFPGKSLHLICGDYFTVDLGQRRFDAALSFQSLHHFTHNEKRSLYRRILRALRPGGMYIEADYIVKTQAEEDAGFARCTALLGEDCKNMKAYHIDVPCTVQTQVALLIEAGFDEVVQDRVWENMAIIVAKKSNQIAA